MKHATTRTRQPLPLARRFERSRLEEDVLTAAYALVLPVVRRPLPSPGIARQPKVNQASDDSHPPTVGERRA
jgi:hypothetical protein